MSQVVRALRAAQERFKERIEVVGDCHVWQVRRGRSVVFSVEIAGQHKVFNARRVAWMLAHQTELDRETSLRLLCGNGLCVNPSHCVATGTQAWTEADANEILARKFGQPVRNLRRCLDCGSAKPISAFGGMDSREPGGPCQRDPFCLECRGSRTLPAEARAAVSALLSGARKRAKVKGRDFTLTHSYAQELWREQDGKCALSGLPFVRRLGCHGLTEPQAPSIDRIDSRLGYVPGNVRFVCLAVNIALNHWGTETVLPIMEAVIERQKAA